MELHPSPPPPVYLEIFRSDRRPASSTSNLDLRPRLRPRPHPHLPSATLSSMLFFSALAFILPLVTALPTAEPAPALVATPVEAAKRHYKSGGKDCYYKCPDSVWVEKGSPWDHWDWSKWSSWSSEHKRTLGFFSNGYSLSCDHGRSEPDKGLCKYYHPDLLSSLLQHTCSYDHQSGVCTNDLFKRTFEKNESDTESLEERTFWKHPCPPKAPGPYCDYKPQNAFKRSSAPRERTNAERAIQARQYRYRRST